MAEGLAIRLSRGHRTICLPIAEETHRRIVGVPREFRRAIEDCFRIRPSFLMPYLTARTEDAEAPLFLRKSSVPSWAIARVFGGDPMS